MKRLVMVALVAGAIGFVAGALFWWLASPLWTRVEVNESLSAEAQTAVLASGAFRDADAVHKGSGDVSLFRGADGTVTLRMTDFSGTNGPDLKVWLVEAENIQASADVTNSTYLSLGPLKGTDGDQNYTVPADADVGRFNSVVIWCEAFSVLFSAADLEPA